MRTDVGAGCVYFLDAAGNVVELISSPQVEDGRRRTFGPGSLIEIGEIGIAATDYERPVRHWASSSARASSGVVARGSLTAVGIATRW